MFNLVISFEKCNLNPFLDLTAAEDRNLLLTETTSETIINEIFRELILINSKNNTNIFFSASRYSEIKMFDINEISYIESFGNLKCINSCAGSFEFYGTLYRIEEAVGQFGFVRIHNSYIISLKHVKSTCSRYVLMDDGKMINIGRKYASGYKKALEGMKYAYGGGKADRYS